MTSSASGERSLADALDAGLVEIGLPLESSARAALLAYVALLAKWNQTYNLTAIREPGRMVTHHLLDSLAVLPALDAFAGEGAGVEVLDVGSGAGLPGIPLAIARPAWRVTMLEPVHKKAAFITQAIAELRVGNAQATAKRVEDHRAPSPATFAISRAFSDLASFAQSSIRHVAEDGALMAMKGVHPDEELRELPPQFAVTQSLSLRVPGVDAARHLIVIQRAARREGDESASFAGASST